MINIEKQKIPKKTLNTKSKKQKQNKKIQKKCQAMRDFGVQRPQGMVGTPTPI